MCFKVKITNPVCLLFFIYILLSLQAPKIEHLQNVAHLYEESDQQP